jgi:competence protein ComEC
MMKIVGRIRQTTLLAWGLVGFLSGLVTARAGVTLSITWLLLCLLLVIATYRRHSYALAASLLLTGMVLGIWRGSIYMQRVEEYDALYGQQIILIGRAETDAVYDNRSQLAFDLGKLQLHAPYATDLVGKVGAAGFGVNAVYRGDVVEVKGKLFPSLGARRGRISFAQIKVLGRPSSTVETIRHNFEAGLQTALPEPQAAFGLGLLIGQRNNLPDEVNDNLSKAGLTHIVAVSGYNLTILVQAMRRLNGKRSKYQSTLLSVGLIGSFLLLTGLSPSIVRAAIVSLLSLAAWYYGRTIKPVLLLLIAAAITAGWNPLYIWSDVGWYLSFLAFFGVLVVAPLMLTLVRGHKPVKFISQIVTESLAAQLMTLPVILFLFQQGSLVSLLANVIVVPFIPLAMLTSLIAGLVGWWLPSMAGWFAIPAKLILTYALEAANVLAGIPHAVFSVSLSAPQMISLYSIILLLVVAWSRRARENRPRLLK